MAKKDQKRVKNGTFYENIKNETFYGPKKVSKSSKIHYQSLFHFQVFEVKISGWTSKSPFFRVQPQKPKNERGIGSGFFRADFKKGSGSKLALSPPEKHQGGVSAFFPNFGPDFHFFAYHWENLVFLKNRYLIGILWFITKKGPFSQGWGYSHPKNMVTFDIYIFCPTTLPGVILDFRKK